MTLTVPTVRAFRDTFAGDVVLPADATYDDARRVWNAMIDRRPAMVVRPTGPDDVATAIRFARDHDLVIAVRGGGHSMSGHSTCDEGLVIDLSGMRGVTVDPDARTARANGGALLGELDAAAQAYGLVCPVGVVSHTGVGGLTLGGGMGRLQRKLGFTIDNLRRVELVTADGRKVAASETENPDLFWAVRGAGANFGVVTSFEFALHPFGGVLTRGVFTFPGDDAADVWAAFRDFATTAPEDIHAAINFSRALPEADYPAEVAGQPIVSVGVNHAGDPADAERVLAPVRSLGTAVSGSLAVQEYLTVQRAADEAMGWGHRVYTKGGFTNDLPEETIWALVDHAARATSENEGFGMWTQGGAVAQVSEDATAFTGRSARFQMSSEAGWDDPAEDQAHIGWARAAFALVEPHAATGHYVNDMTESGGDLARTIYGDAKYERLRAVKRAWDPDNVFHLNQNIAP